MATYPNLNNDPELLKIGTKDDEVKDLKITTEKHDYENTLKSLKIDSEYYKKRYKSLNKKKVSKIISEILFGGVGLGLGSGLTKSGLAPVGIMCASSISFLSSISTLFTNEYFSKLKIRFTKLSDWNIFITLLNEKTLESSMVDEKLDEKEAQELKKIYNQYLERRKKIMKNTQLKFEDIFDDIINEDTISQDQLNKLNIFLARMM